MYHQMPSLICCDFFCSLALKCTDLEEFSLSFALAGIDYRTLSIARATDVFARFLDFEFKDQMHCMHSLNVVGLRVHGVG